jgi:hypothetical protein
MRILTLFFAMFCFGQSFSQVAIPNSFFSLVGEIALPPNSKFIGSSFKPGMGGSIMYGRKLPQTKLYITGSLTAFQFNRNPDTLNFTFKNGGYTIFSIGVRNYLARSFYGFGELGVAFTNKALETGQTQLSAGIGIGNTFWVYKKNGIDASVKYFYSKYKVNNDTWVGFKIGYILGF